jgi:hypothetical protein
MKKIVMLGIILLLTGCGDFANMRKHFSSSLSGLHRRITLLNANGTTNRVWETKAKVEDKGGSCFFINSYGKAVIVSGTFVIEEL